MFERVRYPDGQITARFIGFTSVDTQLVKERINSYEDLFYIAAIDDIARYMKLGPMRLYIPCLFGQRSDRRLTNNQSFDLKLITDVINSCDFTEVSIFDPHSDVSLALINNSRKISSFEYVQKAVDNIDINRKDRGNPLVLCSPDGGSYKKVFEYGEKLNLPVVAAVKYRDLEGKIDLMFMGDVKDKDCLIVDDLCDGGYTFEVLGKKLKEQGAKKVYLYVSHGLFSKGFGQMFDAGIDKIYCTNSIKDLSKWVEDEKGRIFTCNEGYSTDYIIQYKVI